MSSRYSLDPRSPPIDLLDTIGGQPGVRRLVDSFYDHMDSLPEAATIRAMHQPDLSSARQKLFEFLVGWMGGPPLYVEKYGHPRLRRRHMPFPVDQDAAWQWLNCMNLALKDTVDNEAAIQQLSQSFARVAAHMINRESS